MQRYYLPDHVFVCRRNQSVVFLDLRSDQYFLCTEEHARCLHPFIAAWPGPPPDEVRDVSGQDENACEVIRTMLGQHLITECQQNAKDASPVTLDAPQASLSGDGGPVGADLGVKDVCLLLTAVVSARIRLRRHPLERVVTEVRQHRLRVSNECRPYAADRAHRLVSIFERVKPLLFSAREACLFDSLALAMFLRRYQIYPQWVFGVQTDPFRAHCWLQYGDLVLNDSVDHVTTFTPIMAA